MLKIWPVPNPLVGMLYLLPFAVFAVVSVIKLRVAPSEERNWWLVALSMTLTLTAFTMSLMRFPP